MSLLVLAGLALAAEPTTLTLDEALQRLDDNNPDLAALEAKAREADATTRLALAQLLPGVGATADYTRNNEEVRFSFQTFADMLPFTVDETALPDDLVLQPLDSWTVGAGVRVPILSLGAIADVRAASAMADAAQAQADSARLQMQTGLLQACAYAAAAEGVAEAARRVEQATTARRDAMKRAVDAGTQPPVMLVSAETDLVRRQSERVQAEADLQKVRRAMGALLGLPGEVKVTADTIPTESTGDAVRTPDVVAAEAQALAAGRAVTSAVLRYTPTLTGTFGAQASTEPFVTGDKTAWRAGLNLTWILYDGGAREARIAGAAARSHAADSAAESARLKAGQAVDDATRDLEVAKQRLALAEQTLELARKAEGMSQRGLAAGTVTPLDARDAEDQAFRADVAVAQAKAGVAVAEANLRKARGQGW